MVLFFLILATVFSLKKTAIHHCSSNKLKVTNSTIFCCQSLSPKSVMHFWVKLKIANFPKSQIENLKALRERVISLESIHLFPRQIHDVFLLPVEFISSPMVVLRLTEACCVVRNSCSDTGDRNGGSNQENRKINFQARKDGQSECELTLLTVSTSLGSRVLRH